MQETPKFVMAAVSMHGCVKNCENKYVVTDSILTCSFRNGALIAAGTVFLTQGVLWASHLINNFDRHGSLPWAGYFLQVSLLPTLQIYKHYHAPDLRRLFPTRLHDPSLLLVVSHLACVWH